MIRELIESPFHPGERAAQLRAGSSPRGAAIRDWMPDQHRAFFAALPFVLTATTDAAGWPVATVLAGAPGCIASPDPWTLRIAARREGDDPAAQWLKPEASIALLGIDLATRRRNRANGVIASATERALAVAVRESFGNCPQYIHIRDLEVVPATPPATEVMNGLDHPSREAIEAADTFFVATSGGAVGVDISHRGGRPGFVRVDGNTLTIPDFSGNRYFNTLGNMLLDARAALLFADFASGDVLHVQGHTEIVWEMPATERLLGAERLWRVSVTHAWRRRGVLPFRWSLRAQSPSVARTGSWNEIAAV